ncbi:NACHT domain-containing protein [Madurella fahalii]|uniref:NACHT domain-containing protein n=1 Tax=Madurella fahalii TaxID=1157608 RepID=A0ABQ0G1Z0_9PEZI
MEVAASLAGLVSLSLSLLKGLVGYYSSYRSANPEIECLCHDIENVAQTLQNLEEAIRQEKAQLDIEESLFKQCKGCIDELASELSSLARVSIKHGYLWARIESKMKRAKYPFKEKTLEKLRGRVSKVNEMLQQAASTVLIQQGTRINKAVNRLCEQEIAAAVFRWLDAPNFTHSHETARLKRTAPETGTWLIQDAKFQSWKTTSNSVLWIQAASGSGKTVLCSTLIDHLAERCVTRPTDAIAYFYFDLTNKSTSQDHSRFLRSLVEQLSAQQHHQDDTAVPPALRKLYAKNLEGTRQPTEADLIDTLRAIIVEAFPTSCYLVIDAVDEVKEKPKLLSLLDQVVGEWQLPQLHFLLTSRTELDAELPDRSWGGAASMGIQGRFVDADVHRHVLATLRNKNEELGRWDPARQKIVAESLIAKANGNFRWVACQLEALQGCCNRKELSQVLRSLPPTLETTYERTLLSVVKPRAQAFRHVLQWLCFSARPLHLDEIAAVYGIDLGSNGCARDDKSGGSGKRQYDPDQHLENAEGFFSRYSSLVTVLTVTAKKCKGQAMYKELRFAHLSVRDYLLSNTITGSPASYFSITPAPGHREVAKSCIAYLRHVCCLLARVDAEKLPDDPRVSKCYALAQYAARHWARHVRAAVFKHDGEYGLDGGEKDWGDLSTLCLELLRDDQLPTLLRFYDPDLPWIETPLVSRSIGSIASPLYYAALYGLTEAVMLLLEQEGTDVNLTGGRYGTALQAAACKGHEGVVQMLLRHGVDVDKFGGDYGTALIGACCYGHEGCVRLLLEHGANINAQGVEHHTALHGAAYNGHGRVVELLLAHRDINIEAVGPENGSRRTPLWEAAAQGHARVVEILLAHGADSLARDYGDWTTIDEAATAGYDDVVRVLAQHDKSILEEGGALHYAAVQQQLSTIRILIDHGIDVDNKRNGGITPLHQAIRTGARTEVVECLLEAGASVSHPVKSGWRPIHRAAFYGLVDVAEALRVRGAEINQGPSGWTPLHIAVLRKQAQFVQWLIENQVDRGVKARGRYTARDCIRFHNTNKAAEAIENFQLESFSEICIGLRTAAAKGQNVRIRELIERGADINARDEGGDTALNWAVLLGRCSTVKLLLENGADGEVKLNPRLIDRYKSKYYKKENEACIAALFAEFGYTIQPMEAPPIRNHCVPEESRPDEALEKIKDLLYEGGHRSSREGNESGSDSSGFYWDSSSETDTDPES